MRPEPIRRKGRKTLAKVYDSLSDPEKAPDRSRIIGPPTKKEAHDIRNELTAAAWVGGKSVSRIRTAKEYISIVESFFRKLRAIKNAEPRTPQTGIPSLRELLRDTPRIQFVSATLVFGWLVFDITLPSSRYQTS